MWRLRIDILTYVATQNSDCYERGDSELIFLRTWRLRIEIVTNVATQNWDCHERGDSELRLLRTWRLRIEIVTYEATQNWERGDSELRLVGTQASSPQILRLRFMIYHPTELSSFCASPGIIKWMKMWFKLLFFWPVIKVSFLFIGHVICFPFCHSAEYRLRWIHRSVPVCVVVHCTT